MKKIKVFMVMAAMAAATTVVTSCSNKDDIDKANQRIDQVENRLSTLEQQVNTANTNISSLQAMVSTLSNAEYVTAVTPTANGYTLTFRSGQTATIANGKDGADGATPQISVKRMPTATGTGR